MKRAPVAQGKAEPACEMGMGADTTEITELQNDSFTATMFRHPAERRRACVRTVQR